MDFKHIHKNCDIIKCKNDYNCDQENILIKTKSENKIKKYNTKNQSYCITFNDKQYYLDNEKKNQFKIFLENKPAPNSIEEKLIDLIKNQNDMFLREMIASYEKEDKNIDILAYNLPFIIKHKLEGKKNPKNVTP